MMQAGSALLLCDLQNDFLHENGAYGRAGLATARMADLPARIAPFANSVRAAGGAVIATHFTLVPGFQGAPLISPHLAKLRPFLGIGDFAPNSWGQRTVADLQPVDFAVEKIAYSAFYMTHLEWLLRKLGVMHLWTCGIVTNGGVTATVRDAAVREFAVSLLEDGCAAFDHAAHETAVAGLRGVCEITTIGAALQRI